jgi:hypothetical protein
MATDEGERREYFRITDRLLVEIREIDYEESLDLAKNLQQSDFLPDDENDTSSHSFRPPVFASNDLYEFLEVLDRKLNVILELLLKKDERFRNEYTDVNISAAGLRYTSEKQIKEGTYVDLRIVLPYFPNPRIAAVGMVVRSGRAGCEEGKDIWETAIKLIAISERQRDMLISYVFAKEREQLRAKNTL